MLQIKVWCLQSVSSRLLRPLVVTPEISLMLAFSCCLPRLRDHQRPYSCGHGSHLAKSGKCPPLMMSCASWQMFSNLPRLLPRGMERTPHTPHTLIRTCDLPSHPFVDLATGISQQFRLLQHLLHLQIPHAYSLLLAIDVMSSYHGMRSRPWRDVDFDPGI